MRSREISLPGMAVAAILCLIATGMAMTDATKFGALSLALFSFAWLIFYVAIAMPFKSKSRASSSNE